MSLSVSQIQLLITTIREAGTAIQEISDLMETDNEQEQLKMAENIEARMDVALANLRKATGKDE